MSYIVTPEYFLKVAISSEMKQRAQQKAAQLGTLKNSIRKGAGNLAGFLGEEVVLAAWGGSSSSNTYDYDILFENVKFEIKTKDRTVVPRLDYEASVADFNTRQLADFYVFVSLFRDKKAGDYTEGYICGIVDKAVYKTQCHTFYKGDVDPSNGWMVSADCYNLPYGKLARFQGW